MIPVTVHGNTYRSISAAWRELESPVPQITVRWRLKNGWSTEDAFSEPAVIPEDRCKFKGVRES